MLSNNCHLEQRVGTILPTHTDGREVERSRRSFSIRCRFREFYPMHGANALGLHFCCMLPRDVSAPRKRASFVNALHTLYVQHDRGYGVRVNSNYFRSVTISEKSAIEENSRTSVCNRPSRLARRSSSSTITMTLSKKASMAGRRWEISMSAGSYCLATLSSATRLATCGIAVASFFSASSLSTAVSNDAAIFFLASSA